MTVARDTTEMKKRPIRKTAYLQTGRGGEVISGHPRVLGDAGALEEKLLALAELARVP